MLHGFKETPDPSPCFLKPKNGMDSLCLVHINGEMVKIAITGGKNNMKDHQHQLLGTLEQHQANNTKDFINYWLKYSSVDNWHFWVNVVLFIAPLIILFFKMDRKKALLLGFFGFNVHVWFTYIDTIGNRLNFWTYPYQLMPLISVNFGLDVSFIPIVYMFLYQWVLNHNKNYYLYFTGLCLVLSFIFKPLLGWLDFFELKNGATYFHLFIGYVVIMLVSKWITNLFVHFEKVAKQEL